MSTPTFEYGGETVRLIVDPEELELGDLEDIEDEFGTSLEDLGNAKKLRAMLAISIRRVHPGTPFAEARTIKVGPAVRAALAAAGADAPAPAEPEGEPGEVLSPTPAASESSAE
jgi:hypothetical protein